MIVVDRTIVSDELADEFFTCDLDQCQGACCRCGDQGAPLDDDELPVIGEFIDQLKPYLGIAGRREIEKNGPYIGDVNGTWRTPVVDGRECAYAVDDENGTLKCAFEQAYRDGITDFPKPVSCHLYPVRVTRYAEFDALNYHRWNICSAACSLGSKAGIPIYEFVKEALIRKYGPDWYDALVKAVET